MMDDPLDIPAFLRIPQAQRAAARARHTPTRINGHAHTRPQPGDVCRRAGIPDGIDQDLVERVEMLEAAREAKSKASLYAMDERRQQDKAESKAVRATARAVNGKTKRKRRSK